jgi:hypothetical protein
VCAKRVPVNGQSVVWFDRVFQAYPRKDRKQAAVEAWVDLAPTEDLAATILADIQARLGSVSPSLSRSNGRAHGRSDWVRIEGRFIPHLVRYLRERQWEDFVGQEVPPVYEDIETPHAWTCHTCGAVHEGTRSQVGQCLGTPVVKES